VRQQQGEDLQNDVVLKIKRGRCEVHLRKREVRFLNGFACLDLTFTWWQNDYARNYWARVHPREMTCTAQVLTLAGSSFFDKLL